MEPALLAFDVAAKEHEFLDESGGSGKLENSPAALRKFFVARLKRGPLRLVLEATGVYFLDAALIASELGVEVMVLNPRAAHHFAQVLMRRSKTDRLDAATLLEYLKRMPFVAWHPPARHLLELRQFGRYLSQLTEEQISAKNRLHALESSEAAPALLRRDLGKAISSLEGRIERIQREAMKLVRADEQLRRQFDALDSIVGVAETSALMLLAEMVTLPLDLNSRECASHAGLDVRLHESGSSVHRPARISRHGNKYLRRALFMPSLAAVAHDPYARAFRERLVARGKKKMQAQVAVMRKMLTAAWALFKQPGTYDGARLYQVETA